MSASREKNKRKQISAEPVSASNQKKGMSKSLKWTLGVVCAVFVIALTVFFTMLTNGFFAEHTTAAIASGHKLTPAEVNYFYRAAYTSLQNQFGDFFSYMIDTETPLDEQVYDEETGATWADVLTEQALQTASQTYAVYDEAIKNGYTLSDDEIANIDASVEILDLYASGYGLNSANAFLTSQYGSGANTKSYRSFLEVNTLAESYASHVNESFTYSADAIDDAYAADPDAYDTVNYRLYVINDSFFPAEEDASEDEESEDEAAEVDEDALKAQMEALAKQIAEQTQGDEAAFNLAALQNAPESTRENYQDDSYTLRSVSSKASTVTELADWLYDGARQFGDTTYVESSNGYYVAFYLSRDTHDEPMPNVRHILVRVSDTTDEEAMSEAQAKAEEILAEYEAGEKSEDAFIELVKEYSDDGNAEEGGLYENIAPGYMVEEFEDWCYDDSRAAGDTGIIQTSYGYHVMYFSGDGDNLRDYLVESALRQADYSAWNEATTADASYTTNDFGMNFTTK